ncbi:MAG TPA: DUF465 domain-containing protein [Polyangiales bacterium]|nr:DUF465 domain-containing protein [Polyangiales bacterium]
MHNEQHELTHEFPEYRERIHTLKTDNAHFRHMFNEYHDLDRQLHRANTNVEPLSDEHAEQLKRRRLLLKDELYALLKAY